MRFYVPLLAMLSCADKESPSTPPDLEIGGGSDDACAGTAPVIESLGCENSGMMYHADSGGDRPTFTITASVFDQDGDLTAYSMLVDFDQSPDGELDSSADSFPAITGTLSSGVCDVSQADIGARLFLQGGMPAPSTEYEWHVSVFDAAGERSSTESIVCTTPAEDGTGGVSQGGSSTSDTGG
jgi:hypothetical protein